MNASTVKLYEESLGRLYALEDDKLQKGIHGGRPTREDRYDTSGHTLLSCFHIRSFLSPISFPASFNSQTTMTKPSRSPATDSCTLSLTFHP